MYHPIVKEQVNPGQLEGLQTNPDTTKRYSKCQAVIQLLFSPHSVEILASVDFQLHEITRKQTASFRRNAQIPEASVAQLHPAMPPVAALKDSPTCPENLPATGSKGLCSF
jgi:hypothetical protein